MRPTRYSLALVLLVAALRSGLAGLQHHDQARGWASSGRMGLVVWDPPAGEPDATLVGTSGRPFSLALRGGFDVPLASLAGTGRAIDHWDVNLFRANAEGSVLIFRHSVAPSSRAAARESTGLPGRPPGAAVALPLSRLAPRPAR